VVTSLETQLELAERLTETDKVRARLALVRSEFEYTKRLAHVVHLYHACQIQPDPVLRDRLLDAIDDRNSLIESHYEPEYRRKMMATWGFVPFPSAGHSEAHLRLVYDRYQEPFAKTPLNWDTEALRAAPVPSTP